MAQEPSRLLRAFACGAIPLVVSTVATCPPAFHGPISTGGVLWLVLGPIPFVVGITLVVRHLRARGSILLGALTAATLLMSLWLGAAALTIRPSPDRVSTDWVKVRAYELGADGIDRVRWTRIDDERWWFPNERFGARRFPAAEPPSPAVAWPPTPAKWVVILAPQGDDFAYALLPDGRILRSSDDAFSVGCDWPSLQTRTDFSERWLDSWTDIR